MGSSNDVSATNGNNSIGDPPAPNSNLFSDGEKVLAYHGPRIYEAEVQKAKIMKNEWKYFIHYLGWSKNWDVWVSADRLMKHTEENILKQLALDKKQGVDKDPKSRSSVQNKPKFLSGTKGKKRKGESGPEKDIISEEKLVKNQIPSTLKKQLVDDWEFITQQDKLVKLPHSPTVDELLTKYQDYRSKKEGMFLQKNQGTFFQSSYDESKIPEGSSNETDDWFLDHVYGGQS